MSLTGIKDLDLTILLNMDDVSLENMCRVNKYAKKMCNNNYFWYLKFTNIIKNLPFDKSIDYKSLYFEIHNLNDFINFIIYNDNQPLKLWLLKYHLTAYENVVFNKLNDYLSSLNDIHTLSGKEEVIKSAYDWVLDNKWLLNQPQMASIKNYILDNLDKYANIYKTIANYRMIILNEMNKP